MAESAVRVIVSPSLSDGDGRGYVVVDAATGEVVDDARGCGHKTAQSAHRAPSCWRRWRSSWSVNDCS